MAVEIFIYASGVFLLAGLLVDTEGGAPAFAATLLLALMCGLCCIIPAGLAYLFECYMGAPFWPVFFVALILLVFRLFLGVIRLVSTH